MKELKRRDTQMLLGTLGDRALGIIRKERLRLSDMFKRLDENGDGVVSKLEFEDGIAGMNLNLSKVEIQKLQHALDVDGDGFIDYGELSAFLKASDKERAAKVEVRKKRGARSPKLMKAKIKAQSRKKKAHDAPQLFSKKRDGSPLMFLSHGVRSYIHKNRSTVREMFNALDSNRNGMLSRKEFMKAFVILGFSLDTKEVDKLFAALDKNGDGCIDYAEMFSGVSSGKDMRKAAVYARNATVKEIIPTRHTRSSALRLGLLDHGTKKATGTGNNGKGKNKGNKKGKKNANAAPEMWRPVGPVRRLLKSSISSPALLPSLGTFPHASTATASMGALRAPGDGTGNGNKHPLFKPRKGPPKPTAEQIVLRCIVVREGYLEEALALTRQILQRYAQRSSGSMAPTILHGETRAAQKRNRQRKIRHLQRQMGANHQGNRRRLRRQGRISSGPVEASLLGKRNLNSLTEEAATICKALRTISSETVEAIVKWQALQHQQQQQEENEGRKTQKSKHPTPFLWGSQNYLLKMGTDTGFLYGVRSLLAKALVRMDEALENRKVFMKMSMTAFKKRRASLAVADGMAEQKGAETGTKDVSAMSAKNKIGKRGTVSSEESSGNPLDALSPASLAKLLMNIDEFTRLFKEADESGDGILQKDEFNKLFADLGLDAEAEEMEALYLALDRDGDGEVDGKELFNALQDTDKARELDNMRMIAAERVLKREREHFLAENSGMGSESATDSSSNELGQSEHPEGSSAEGLSELSRLFHHARALYEIKTKSVDFGTFSKLLSPVRSNKRGPASVRNRDRAASKKYRNAQPSFPEDPLGIFPNAGRRGRGSEGFRPIHQVQAYGAKPKGKRLAPINGRARGHRQQRRKRDDDEYDDEDEDDDDDDGFSTFDEDDDDDNDYRDVDRQRHARMLHGDDDDDGDDYGSLSDGSLDGSDSFEDDISDEEIGEGQVLV